MEIKSFPILFPFLLCGLVTNCHSDNRLDQKFLNTLSALENCLFIVLKLLTINHNKRKGN